MKILVIGHPNKTKDILVPDGYEITTVHRDGSKEPDYLWDIFSPHSRVPTDLMIKGPFHVIDIAYQPSLLRPHRYSIGVYQTKIHYNNLHNSFKKLKKILSPDGFIYFDRYLQHEISKNKIEVEIRNLNTLLIPENQYNTIDWDISHFKVHKISETATQSIVDRISKEVTKYGFHDIIFYDQENNFFDSPCSYLATQVYKENRKIYVAQKIDGQLDMYQ